MDVKRFLVLLPEGGLKLLSFHLITLNGEVIEPGISLLTDRSFQSLGCLNPSPQSKVLANQGTQVYPKRFSNQLDGVFQVQSKVWCSLSLSLNALTQYKVIVLYKCLELISLKVHEVCAVLGILGTFDLLDFLDQPGLGTNLWT